MSECSEKKSAPYWKFNSLFWGDGGRVQRSIWHVHEHCTSIHFGISALHRRVRVCTAICWVCKLGQAVITDALHWPYRIFYILWVSPQLNQCPRPATGSSGGPRCSRAPSGCFALWFCCYLALILINFALFLIKAGLILRWAALEHAVPELPGRSSADSTSAGGSCSNFLFLNDPIILEKLEFPFGNMPLIVISHFLAGTQGTPSIRCFL